MLDLDREIDSLANFKQNTPEFLRQLKKSGNPVFLTIDGKAEVVVQDADSYRKLLDLADGAKTIEAIRRGLEDVRAGRTQPIAEAVEDIRRELGVSRGS